MQLVFNERSLASAIRAGDSRRFGIDLKNDRKAVLDAAIAYAAGPSLALGPVHTSTAKGRLCKSLPDYSQNLLLRLASTYVSRRFRVEVGSRDRKVLSLIEALSDSAPFFVIRRDIRSFYETVPVIAIQQRLIGGSELPPSIRKVVEAFFHTFCSGSPAGLPRGICLSTVLSELAMQDFDARVRALSGVYRYFRYSDDIIVLAYANPDTIESTLPNLLPDGMSFNPTKSYRVDVNKPAKQASERYFEYLGYGFAFLDHGSKREPRIVRVSIAAKKLDRIKTRLICAFKSHAKNPDFPLLERRIRFTAGNVSVLRQSVSAVKSSRYVKSGIFYSYKLCGEYKAGGVNPHEGNELKAVDGFYQSLVKNAGRLGAALTGSQQASLRAISFYQGYSLKRAERFTAAEIQQIKSVWKNA